MVPGLNRVKLHGMTLLLLMVESELSGNVLSALGLFLSGMGSVLTGYMAIRYEHKRSVEECRRRIEALFSGVKLKDDLEESRKEMTE